METKYEKELGAIPNSEKNFPRSTRGAAWHEESVWLRNGLLIMPCADVATSRIAALTVTTEHGPWRGTNNGHPTMILTGMTHGHYQPALHPPPSDLGKFSPLVPTLPEPPPRP